MKAATRYRYGSPDVVGLEDLDVPKPGEGEVLVRVHTASVNRADLDSFGPRPGFARLFTGVRAPRERRVGIDVTGVVEATGTGTARFKVGDRVFGDLFSFGQGAFGEYVCAKEAAFEPIPDGLSFEDAATLPHSAVLAIQALRLRRGRTLGAGQRLLVLGASGNVGPFVVQLAKARGAHVTGVSSGDKLGFVQSLGADAVIDYRATDPIATGERYDWIVDTDSHASLFRVRRALRPNGVYLTLGGSSGKILTGMLGPLRSLVGDKWAGLMLWWKPFHRPDVATLTEMVAAGTIRPAIDRSFPLDEVVDALRYVDEGRARGKVLVKP
jgi:NADPH:quinone reductase-like Zn-dependent oxidoreductase